ncbi:MAG: mechanosensitive ion channel [Pedobacter sp.]|nr:MAG: mechanosensitive ion channel [Pedobacter sp.]
MLKNTQQYICLIILSLFSLTGTLDAQTSVGNSKKPPLEKEVLLIKSSSADTSINTFITKVEYYSNSFNSMTSLLAKGFDTVEISRQLPKIDSLMKFIKGSYKVNDRSNTLRSLYVIRDILTHQEDQLSAWQSTLAGYNTRLVQIQSNLIRIKEDRTLSYVPSDSLLKDEYREQMDGLNRKWARMDASNRKVMREIGLLQSLVVQYYINVTNYKERVNMALRNFGKRAFSEEYPYLWQSGRDDYAQSFVTAYNKTMATNAQLLDYFISANWPVHIWCILILIGFYGWTLYTTRKIRNENEDRDTVLSQAHYIPGRTLLSALVVSFLLGTFLYDHPPVIFVELMMLVVLIATGLLVKRVWPSKIFKFWLVILLLSIVTSFSNLFLLASYTDRIIIFILGIVGGATGYFLLKTVRLKEDRYPVKTALLLQIFIAFQSLSVLMNLFGRFSLAKILLVTSLFGLWQALTLVVFVRVIMEAVFLQLEASKENDGKPTYFDFQGLQQRFKTALSVIAIILWLILLAGNLNVLDTVYDFISSILTQPRKIGETTFTFSSLIIFLIIIYVASLISKAITYFFEFADFHSSSQTRKNKLSSSILLVKLGIFSVGFLLAIAASGIPIERITIILGALSVGIGFGLQTIVNNLVSGVILAIEKPVQIGDLIEIGTRSGTVKSMGIRASKIATSDGSEVIVPNGDLLSQHLVNWTLSDKHRRVELIIGVTYGSDLNRVLALLRGIVNDSEDIMHDPAPMVLIHNFAPSSVDFRILFWVPEIGNWLTLKSQVLSDIYEVFYSEGIEMPFPQTDVHLHYPDGQPKAAEEPSKDVANGESEENEPPIAKL